MTQIFINNDESYRQWVEQHPNGFVLNCVKGNPHPYVVHSASCVYLAPSDTTKDYLKIVTDNPAVAYDFGADECGHHCMRTR